MTLPDRFGPARAAVPGESSQDHPAVEPHIMLSKVWNALAENAESAATPVPGG
jgi:hypothetical protein